MHLSYLNLGEKVLHGYNIYKSCYYLVNRKTQIGDYEVEQVRTARYIGPEMVCGMLFVCMDIRNHPYCTNS